MAREKLLQELEKVQRAIFMEQMADFMNWGNYRRLREKEEEIKKQLAEF